jgi:predicted alpha/beta hydrolase
MTKTCVWVLSDVGEFPVRYCGRPTAYVMKRDDDDVPRRAYDHLCEEHKKAAAEQPSEDDD